MARGQQDYYQSTRGGGHGDYRHIVLAPMDIREAVELTQLAFHLADKWRNPVLVYGDYLIAHIQEAVDVTPIEFDEPLPAKDWAVDGSLGGQRQVAARVVARLRQDRASRRRASSSTCARWPGSSPRSRPREVRVETGLTDDAETVIVAFGSPGKFVRYVVEAAARRGREDRLRAPDHPLAVPVRSRRRGG